MKTVIGPMNLSCERDGVWLFDKIQNEPNSICSFACIKSSLNPENETT